MQTTDLGERRQLISEREGRKEADDKNGRDFTMERKAVIKNSSMLRVRCSKPTSL